MAPGTAHRGISRVRGSGLLAAGREAGRITCAREGGQATVEYILLLAFVLSVGVGITRVMIDGVDNGILLFGGVLEKDLQTGRMPAGAWSEE